MTRELRSYFIQRFGEVCAELLRLVAVYLDLVIRGNQIEYPSEESVGLHQAPQRLVIFD